MLSFADAPAAEGALPLVVPLVCGAEVLAIGVPLVVGAGMTVENDDDG